jgi:hypothetical protein
MAQYCYWAGDGYTPQDQGFPTGEGGGAIGWICIDIPDIEIPPEEPGDGEEDPSGEITLPDGTVIDATGLTTPFIGIKQLAWQSSPWKTLWAVRTDGLLLSCTYDKIEDVWAWTRHPMTNGAVVSICVIPKAGSDQEELWAVVRRVMDDATVHYIERMTPRITPTDETDKSDFNYLDCSLSYSGAATTSFSGATHLEDGDYRVWADGADVGDITVTGGAFTLDTAAEKVVVGIHTDATLISLPTAKLNTERQIVQEVVIRFFETLGGQAGVLHGDMTDLQFRSVSSVMDDSPPLWDGDMPVTVGGRHDDSGVYTIIQNTAGPMTILATFPKIKAA